jgi:hypothetical protein
MSNGWQYIFGLFGIIGVLIFIGWAIGRWGRYVAIPIPHVGDWWRHFTWRIAIILVAVLVGIAGLLGAIYPNPYTSFTAKAAWSGMWIEIAFLTIIVCVGWVAAVLAGRHKKDVRLALLMIPILGGLLLLFSYFPADPNGFYGSPGGSTQASVNQMGIPLVTPPYDSRTWPKLTIPPKGRSADIILPVGERPLFDNGVVKVHCVYADQNDEGIIGDTLHPCHDGKIVKVYVVNDSEDFQTVPVAFAR